MNGSITLRRHPCKELFAAFTIASTFNVVISPLKREIFDMIGVAGSSYWSYLSISKVITGTVETYLK
jgi:hypothetical protein